MNRISLVIGFALALTFTGSLSAAKLDADQKIVVDAKRQSIDIKSNVVTFHENVLVQQGSMRIEADQLEIHQYQDKGAERLIAIGKPAKFSQLMENGKRINGQANRMIYTLSKQSITLTGEAMLKQEDSEVRGETISYDINNERLIAESGKGIDDRVRTVFLPDQLQNTDEPSQQKKNTSKEDKSSPTETDPTNAKEPSAQEETP